MSKRFKKGGRNIFLMKKDIFAAERDQPKSSYFLFAWGGIVTFLYELIVTIILTEFFDWWVMYSYAFALISGLGLLFLYHSYVTFSIKLHSWRLIKFVSLYGCLYIVAWILVWTATKMGYHYLPSIIIISILLSLASYEVNKKWVFVEEQS